MNAKSDFELMVVEEFSPIMSRYCYSLVEGGDSYARLDSRDCSILVAYDRRRSFVVGVEFFAIVNGERWPQIPFNLGEVFRECGVPAGDADSIFQSTDTAAVRGFLSSVVRMLLQYCGPILEGNRNCFDAVNRRRSLEAAAYTRKLQLESVRCKADEAWRAKKYRTFVDLLGEFGDVLPVSDQKKLECAQKKLIG